ncbi:prefoldin subunit [Candidatus Micrarchaeota archaeon]|nr:prefoldin subunit [Candidatus Micrarchaeota archaeon]
MDHDQLRYQEQILNMQKQQSIAQADEIKHTMEELEKAKGKIYQFHGMLLIESTKKEAKKRLNELKEILDARVKAIDMQLERLNKMLDEGHNKEGKK